MKQNTLPCLAALALALTAAPTAHAETSATRRLLVACCGFELNEAAAIDALKAGADINWQNEAMNGETMLITSLKGQQGPNVIKFLLDHGADAAIKDDKGKTALDWARQYGIGRDRNGRTILAMLESATGARSQTPAPGQTGAPLAPMAPIQKREAPLAPPARQASTRGEPTPADIKAMIESKMTVNYEHHFGGGEPNKVTFEWLGPIQVVGTDVRGRIPHSCWNVKLDVRITFEKPSSGETSRVRRGVEGTPLREMFCVYRDGAGAWEFVTYQP